LLALAKEQGVPYVQVPDTGIQPRSALGFMLRALLKLTGEENLLAETLDLAQTLKPEQIEEQGKSLAQKLHGHVPVIYASRRHSAIAYNWKIKCNETGKIPAFYNVFPELNHNEINAFGPNKSAQMLSESFHFIFLTDAEDHPRIQKRMEVLAKLYRDRSFAVEMLPLAGASRLEKVFHSLILADWVSYYAAELYGLESEQVPMVEEFKKLIL
jgi:glucose/mannose-6-phosphate isomerase